MSKAKFIDASELGGTRKDGTYPYKEWVATIPIGKALDITDILNGRDLSYARSAIYHFLKRHELPLRAAQRRGRLYVIREADDV